MAHMSVQCVRASLAAMALVLVTVASAAVPTEAPEGRTRRIRELIYLLRPHRVFIRTDEWAGVIRELVEIGEPAVPELVAELDRTDRDAMLRALGFTLRAIGDPRALPALIRAIPKTLRPPGSDCGVLIRDPDLRAFMQEHHLWEGRRNPTNAGYGRPVNEILGTLEALTGHREPAEGDDPLRHVFLPRRSEDVDAEGARAVAAKRRRFEERKEHWETWWSGNWQRFVTREQLESVKLARRETDVVAEAGLAAFGPLFPSGGGARLGSVHEVQLWWDKYWDAKSYIDFDTGRAYERYEGIERPVERGTGKGGLQIERWIRQKGLDASVHACVLCGGDLTVWRVEDSRWDTFEEEVRSGHEVKLGQEGGLDACTKDRSRPHTFLFTTREGGRGILRVSPPEEGTDAFHLRYRMIVTDDSEPPPRPDEASPGGKGSSLGESITVTLDGPAVGNRFLLDLESPRPCSPPDTAVSRNKYLEAGKPFVRQEGLIDWCREHGVDVGAGVYKSFMHLVGVDMDARRVLPQSFDTLTVEKVREIMYRRTQGLSRAVMGPDPRLRPQVHTFAFKTAEGSLGVLQILRWTDDPRTITVRYRLRPAG